LRELGPHYGEGLVVSQVVPHYQSGATGVIRYRELLHKYRPEAEPGFISLEGFIAAECLVEGLRRAGPDLTTEKLIDALESIRDLDLGIGPIISLGPSRHQASNKVWGTVLDANRNFQILDLD
jgi:eukaryotic-like serine/threonine-protein kinase